MTRFIFVMGVLLLLFSCSSQKKAIREESKSDNEKVVESVEYGMKTVDTKFASWYLENNDQNLYRSQKYYEDWNIKYVTVWNRRVLSSQRSRIFESSIEYSPSIDYGFDLNHQLFYYFQYVENVLKIKIMQGGPKLEIF